MRHPEKERLENPAGSSYAVDQVAEVLFAPVESAFSVRPSDLNFTESPEPTGCDYGTNLSSAARVLLVSPQGLAESMANELNSLSNPLTQEAVANGPFLNVKIDMPRFGDAVIGQILRMDKDYGKENEGRGQIVVIDMSSPNIAKRMSYGHLRSTIIGDSLANIFRSRGYEVLRDNHLGDWGTQFGKLVAALQKWSSEDELETNSDPIGLMQDLYVRYDSQIVSEKTDDFVSRVKAGNDEALEALGNLAGGDVQLEDDLSGFNRDQLTEVIEIVKKLGDKRLEKFNAFVSGMASRSEDVAREIFAKLEKGDPDLTRVWKLCSDLSMREFAQIYEILGVDFEEAIGESHYVPMIPNLLERMREKNIGQESEGALVIDMNDVGLGVAIVIKSDETSIYMTRDLACAIFREEQLKADRVVYVVGEDQQHYFKQLFEALRRLGYKIGDHAQHVHFGMVSLKEGKMSTRKGRTVLLKDVIDEGFKRADELLSGMAKDRSKEVDLNREDVRRIVVGAIKWNDLCQDPKKSIVFDWDKALRFDGNAAPYVQYAAVRARSILGKAGWSSETARNWLGAAKDNYQENSERALIRQLAEYPNAIRDAMEGSSPQKIAAYVYELAKRFSSFYTKVQVLGEANSQIIESRLRLVAATEIVITNALSLLGIEIPEKM